MHVHAVPCSCLNNLFKTVVHDPKVTVSWQLVQCQCMARYSQAHSVLWEWVTDLIRFKCQWSQFIMSCFLSLINKCVIDNIQWHPTIKIVSIIHFSQLQWLFTNTNIHIHIPWQPNHIAGLGVWPTFEQNKGICPLQDWKMILQKRNLKALAPIYFWRFCGPEAALRPERSHLVTECKLFDIVPNH